MYCLPDYIYLQLLDALNEEDPALAAVFDSYFDDTPVDGTYHLTNDNITGYMNWLQSLPGLDDYGLFLAWDQDKLLYSGQGGGSFNIDPLP